jgi:replicative superfamily II helicase
VSTSPLLQLPNTYRAFYGAFGALRPFQQQTIAPILNGQDVILQAATGSGKTEAVLAPCLERLLRAGGGDAVLYVVPTRALAQDLRRRLTPIVEERLGLRLGIRTGDVKRFPAGQADVLLTTPESLDVMLGSPNRAVQTFLQRVSTCIVDEVHQCLQGARGCHLTYLMQRLASRRRVQTIALSATLAGPQAIRSALGMRADAVWIGNAVQRQIQPHLVHLQREHDELVAFLDDLAHHFGYRKVLLFANSRSHCERLFALLRQRGYFQHATYLHYSNLKPLQRQEVERQFHRRAEALCIATSTLELGIDVGDVDSVVLYEPPESVTTFLQRLGRANRQAQVTPFWGICRGPQASEQLLQFLALYTLAQQGSVETLRPLQLPSVLVQQVLSSLYAHKRVSLPALQACFPPQAQTLATLLPEMAARHWLRRLDDGSYPTWRGGWRYAQALEARQIWSNFPDTEEHYTLQVDSEAVADLPSSVVRQLEPGDQVDLAGKRLRILDIQDSSHKLVRATPVEAPEGKELIWVGSGPAVTWEVAQAVRPLLQAGYEPDARLAPGLFTRPRALLQRQQQHSKRQVVLANGIELSRTPQGMYRYATYLGTVGNLILQRTITAYYAPQWENFVCTATAVAVECSHRIDLQPLPLPVELKAFEDWAAQHLQALQALFPFNAFARALPTPLLIAEATTFLWDERLSQAFAYYRQQTDEIVSGDPRHLEWDDPLAVAAVPTSTLLRQGPQPTLLAQEKIRLGLATDTPPPLPQVPAMHRTPRPLTGTMVGSYMQHQQCDRFLSFELLPVAQQPPKRTLIDSAVGAARAAAGRTFEDGVLEWLAQQDVPLYRVAEHDTAGARLSMQARQAQSMAYLERLVQAGAQQSAITSETAEPFCVGYLVQPVLLFSGPLGASHLQAEPLKHIGIPDVLEVSVANARVWLTVADIKDSVAPRYSQKWQVAFYAAMLQQCLGHTRLTARVADHGVLFTRPLDETATPARHSFALAPYLAAIPLLEQRLARLLQTPVQEAAWQLRTHCVTCPYLDTCYRQAIATDDVMLVPHLTAGEHVKLRTLGLQTLQEVERWLQNPSESPDTPFSRQQTTSLQARLRAVLENRIEVLQPTTTLFPANISTAIFVHVLRDPRRGQPRVWGLQRLCPETMPEPPQCWIATSPAEQAPCQQHFLAQLHAWWREAMAVDHGPHLFTFGARTQWLLQEAQAENSLLEALWGQDSPYHTDVQQLLRQHFTLPIPLHTSLASVARVWGLALGLLAPPYLLQEEASEVEALLLNEYLAAEQMEQLRDYMATHLQVQQHLWQALSAALQSNRQQHDWTTPAAPAEQPLADACAAFLERQQDWRQQDILTVQQLPLAERVERYRALGPLAFQETTLDVEGRFLYHFRLPPETPPGRFRAGDFLKLNPLGSLALQEGASVILAQYAPHAQRLAVVARRRHLGLNTRLQYTLDEDVEDWTTPMVLHAVREAFGSGKHPHLSALLQGTLPLQYNTARPLQASSWLRQMHLNPRQQDALLLPFRSRLGLIEGPPGTGKTHLLACLLIALILDAAHTGRPLRLVVSALTHQAIDNVLLKVQHLLQGPLGEKFPGHCWKWGQRLSTSTDETEAPALTYVEEADEVLQAPYVILGATGYGLYRLFDSQSGHFPAFFDWVIFDEASQVVVPQALLSLIYGKGQYVFSGDVWQLPPVILGPQETAAPTLPGRSILAHLLSTYDATIRVRLNETYRLNQELCTLPSRLWYQGDLHPATANASARLAVPAVRRPDLVDTILAPHHPVALVLAEHTTDHQQSLLEADIMARLALRLLRDYGLAATQLAILAPHRAQNNAIAARLGQLLADAQAPLSLPVIDTVERLQGAEREVILVSLTTSDPDYLSSPFLNHPQRFNVAMTRARHKLVVVGSQAFMTQIPPTDAGLQAHDCFIAYYHLCRNAGALFTWPP